MKLDIAQKNNHDYKPDIGDIYVGIYIYISGILPKVKEVFPLSFETAAYRKYTW